MVERPEMKDQQAGFEALGGRCESCGTCTEDSCLKKLGLEHEDGSRSPSSISPKAEKMYSFFEKSLSLVSSSPTRSGSHLAVREKRSHSLATPAAMANVAQFQELHTRHAQNHLLRTVNMAASNAVLSRISARLRAVTSTTQQESVEEVDEDLERQASQNAKESDPTHTRSTHSPHTTRDATPTSDAPDRSLTPSQSNTGDTNEDSGTGQQHVKEAQKKEKEPKVDGVRGLTQDVQSLALHHST